MFSIPRAFHYADLSLFLLRLMVALVFRSSGSIYIEGVQMEDRLLGRKNLRLVLSLAFRRDEPDNPSDRRRTHRAVADLARIE